MLSQASRIDLLTIRLFVAVVDERTIARAAWRENITTSAVSKRISDLEANLGAALLRRHRQGIEPTQAGRALLVHCRAILGQLDQLCADVGDYREGTRGLIRLAANESAAIGYLPDDIAYFLAASPDVRIDIQVDTSPAVVRKVAENACDVGIFSGEEPTGDLAVTPYREDRLVAVLPADDPLAGIASPIPFVELLGRPFIGSEANGAIEMLTLRAAAAARSRLDTRIRVSSFDAAARLVEAGLGISIMAKAVAHPLSRALRIAAVALEDEWARRRLNICTAAGLAAPDALERFLKALKERPHPHQPDGRAADARLPTQTVVPCPGALRIGKLPAPACDGTAGTSGT